MQSASLKWIKVRTQEKFKKGTEGRGKGEEKDQNLTESKEERREKFENLTKRCKTKIDRMTKKNLIKKEEKKRPKPQLSKANSLILRSLLGVE